MRNKVELNSLAKLKECNLELIEFKIINHKKNIIYKDNNGYIYQQELSNFINHKGYRPFILSNPYALNNIKQYIKLKNIDVKLLSETYIYPKEKLVFKCACGNIFNKSWVNFYGGKQYRCNICAKELNVAPTRKTREEIEILLKEKGYTIIEPFEYKCKDSVIYITDGTYFYNTNYASIKYNLTVKKFHEANIFTLKNIEIYLKELNITSKLLSKTYHGNDSPLLFECKCGNKFKMSLHSLNNRAEQCKCKKCRGTQSIYEKRVKQVLLENNIIFKEEYSFEDCVYKQKLRFDFALFDKDGKLKCLIEVDGQQHFNPSRYLAKDEQKQLDNFEKVKLRDSIKNEYCQTKGIPLLRIKYTKLNKNGIYPSIIKEFISNIY